MNQDTSANTYPGRLVYGISEKNADLLYACRVMLPDPAVYLESGNKKALIAGSFEVPRIKRWADSDITVYSYDDIASNSRAATEKISRPAAVICTLSRRWQVKHWQVPADFPLGLAEELRIHDLVLSSEQNFFPERTIKTEEEISAIERGVRLAETGMRQAWTIIADSTVDNTGQTLYWQNQELTSEILQWEINATIARMGGTAEHTIAACAKQSADPHENGHGPLHAGEPVVIDIFPRENSQGYYGDLSRTVVKGSAPAWLKKTHTAVEEAAKAAIEEVRNGVPARNVHRAADKSLTANGFRTDCKTQPARGFIHGVGHGLGLDVHERPRVSYASSEVLKAGNVITIEPGLYFPEKGGVRIEDVVAVGKNGCTNLTQIDTCLEIA